MGVLDAVYPVSNLFARAAGALGQIAPSGGEGPAGAEEVRELRERNAALEDRVRELEELLRDLSETAEIKAVQKEFMVEAASIVEFEWPEAEVLTREPGLFSGSAQILGGKRNGLKAGLGVVRGNQVVGKVVEAGELVSMVRFLHDPGFKMFARLSGTGQMGLLVGTGRGCELRYLPPDADVQAGDKVVTTGNDGAFPPGLFIGEVRSSPEERIFRTARVDCDFGATSMRTVMVLHPKRTEERER